VNCCSAPWARAFVHLNRPGKKHNSG